MSNKNLDEQGYKLIAEDSGMEVRLDPRETEGYILRRKDSDRKFILLPRGTLEDLAKANRDAGMQIIDNLADYGYFIEGTNLNYDSINAIITKAYLKEKNI